MALSALQVAARLRAAGWHRATVRGISVVHSGYSTTGLGPDKVRVYWHSELSGGSGSHLNLMAGDLRTAGFTVTVGLISMDVTRAEG